MRHAAALSLLLSAAAAAAPDGGLELPRALTVKAAPAQVKLGQPFTVEIAITHAPGQRYELGRLPELGDFEALGQARSRVDGPESSVTTLTLTLAGYALGALRTPALPVEVTGPDGQGTLEAPGAEVEVVASLPAEAQSRGEDLLDVRPPEEVPVPTWRLLWGAGAFLAAAALAWLAYRAWKRRRAAVPPPPPPEPLEVRTRRRLDALRDRGLPEQGAVAAFYFELSLVLRGYLGERFGFEALECTTPELLEALAAAPRPGLDLDQVQDFAWASDFARYAREQPSVEACRQHLDLGYRVVHTTTAAAAPRPPAVGGAGGAA